MTSGRGPGVSFVKTDWNGFTRISAFPLLSLIILLPDLNGAIPKESCFLDLTYFQNGFVLLLLRPSKMLLFMYFHSACRSFLLHSFW